ncbi:hypothetical protein [Arthrobacter castelli]|uniref:hypothetical protein n=1 Tax=Arthrobacter castelli TaxID=271431 RepID=UPI0003F7F72A|nr:hypothetical protein [Arthrobacter castelli]
MPYDYDTQLIESVAVRRTRLTSALLFGQNPLQRRWTDIIKLFLFSVAVAALVAAICVGYSFISNLLAEQRAEQRQRSQSASVIQVMDLPTSEVRAIHG